MTKDKSPSLSYRDAGVDIELGNRLVDIIKPLAAATQTGSGVLSGIGGFGALFELPKGYHQPVLVSGTDGVGTKLKLAMDWNDHSGIGVDLVAMCVNDILVQGAKPLFFLDYFATGKLELALAKTVVAGIANGCGQAGAALIGGETAEMPGFYQGSEYDLAGFCVGVVEKDRIIDGSAVEPGDIIIGLASSGPHSNGYSLIRKIVEMSGLSANHQIEGVNLKKLLLSPTQIYVKPLLQILDQLPIHALAHITGGGLLENLPRVLPAHCQAVIQRSAWPQPCIFSWLQQQGNISELELLRTFNCGVGMILCVAKEQQDTCLHYLEQNAISAWPIGHIRQNTDNHVHIEV